MTKVVVVGGNGFIGSHVKGYLTASGLDVSVVDRHPERYRQTHARFVVGDIDDPAVFRAAADGAQVVVYCATASVPHTSAADPAADVVANLLPFLRFLHLVRRERIRRVVLFSSGGTVYGLARPALVTETHPTNPIVSHGIVKLAMEKYLATSAHVDGLEAIVLRVSNAYGERQDPFGRFGAVATFLGCFARHQPITIWGHGGTIRDYVHVNDIATATVAAVTSKHANGVYNIGSGEGHSLNELVETIADATGQPAPLVRHEHSRWFDVPQIVLDNTRARGDLNWQREISLSQGIAMTWRWVSSLVSSPAVEEQIAVV